MGDVIPMPPRPKIVERFKEVKSYGEFGPHSVVLASSQAGGVGMLAVVLDGLGPGVGFEVLARVHDTEEGRALGDIIANAVCMALMHVVSEGGESGHER